MEVQYAFLCDYADNAGGKLHALGIGVDTVYAPQLPAVHLLLYAVIAIRFSTVEVGQKRLGMHLTDADGRDVVPPLDTPVNVEPPPPGFIYRVQRIALALQGVQFTRYGDYSVRWLVDGREVEVVTLKVTQPPPSPRTA